MSSNEESITITVVGIDNFSNFRRKLTNENLQEVEVYTEGRELCAVYTGYTEVSGKFEIEELDGSMDITFQLNKPNQFLQELAELRQKVELLENR
jgi:anaerobic glycerol-3-phosphate dehydrogenase